MPCATGDAGHCDARPAAQAAHACIVARRLACESARRVQVVHTTYQLRSKKPLDTYQYTANSNNYQDGGSLPAAVFSYDLSPMQVFVTEETKSFASFLTQICAIIGGVFTVTGLIDGLVYHGVSGFSRRMDVLGKSI